MKEKKLDPIYEKIAETLKKYSDQNRISIYRARYTLAVIHRFHPPFNTIIISKLEKLGIIKLNGTRGEIEILI